MTETRPTLYRKSAGHRWEAVAQYSTQELAEAALTRFREQFSVNYTFKLQVAAHRPQVGKCDKRGRWRTSGIRQVTQSYN